jgi:PLP dependent protein
MADMELVCADVFRDNLRRIRDRIEAAAAKAGRGTGEIILMAVTKNFPREAADLAAREGVRLLGENRVQEAEAKFGIMRAPAPLHLIGHLQGNKSKKAAALFDCVQSVDTFETARDLDRHAAALGRKLSVLFQINTSGEESKSGYRDREALLADLERVRSLPTLMVSGLMTIGPLAGGEPAARRAFAGLRKIFDDIRSRTGYAGFNVLSMGMSGDFEAAVAEGSTLVRIGTALFGERG